MYYEKPRHALADPESFQPPLDAEDGLTIHSLSEVESWLIELLVYCPILAPEVSSEIPA